MTMTIDFEGVYSSFTQELSNSQKKMEIASPLGVYYGLSKDGNLRLAFMSVTKPPKMESTKVLQVTQGMESPNVFWTCFDLLQQDAHKVFFAFCTNLVESIVGASDEKTALTLLKKRYITWKTMFKREADNRIPREMLQGLFGEMYFLKKYMLSNYDAKTSILAWGGPDAKSKDFAVGNTWFEVKTIGANTPTTRISSLSQLSSEYDGHLAIIRVESMAEEFSNGESSIGELFEYIFERIHDETVEGIFLGKLSALGVDISDSSFGAKFDVKGMNRYLVNEDFPRLTEESIPFPEISDVSYSLTVSSLRRYMEE